MNMNINIISLCCLIWTILAYALAKRIHQYYGKFWLNPAITVAATTIILMVLLGISYQTYWEDTAWIVALLSPATVAFAIPIYQYRRLIYRYAAVMSASIIVGMVVGIVTILACAKIFHFDNIITYSLMARSISTPFALDLAQKIHGSASLVSLFTLITGIVGLVIGDIILGWSHIRFHLANGVAFGNASHGFGTARASQRNESEGVIASLTMILAGLFMVFFGPFTIQCIIWVFSI